VNVVSTLIMIGLMVVEVYIYFRGIYCYDPKTDNDRGTAVFMFIIIAPIVIIVSFMILVSAFNDCCNCCCGCNKDGPLIGLLVQFAIKVMLVLFCIFFFSLTLKLIGAVVIVNLIFFSLALINKKYF